MKAIYLLILLLLPVMSFAVDAQPALPEIDVFYGPVIVGGVPAPAGTPIIIYVANSYIGNTSVKAGGTYKVYIGRGSLKDTVVFMIDGAVVGTSARTGGEHNLSLMLLAQETKNTLVNSTDMKINFKSNSLELIIATNRNVTNEPLSTAIYNNNAGVLFIEGAKYIKSAAIFFNNTVLSNATIKIYYTDAEASDIDEDSVKMYYYNQTAWQLVENQYADKASNAVIGNVNHFSTYAIFGKESVITPPPTQQTTGGGGSGNGVKTNTTVKNITNTTVCTPNWSCTNWNDCNIDTFTQERKCTGLNSCDTEKPKETQSCTPKMVQDAQEILKRASNVSSDAAKAFLKDAQNAYDVKNYTFASELAERAIDVDSVTPNSLTGLAVSKTATSTASIVAAIVLLGGGLYLRKKGIV